MCTGTLRTGSKINQVAKEMHLIFAPLVCCNFRIVVPPEPITTPQRVLGMSRRRASWAVVQSPLTGEAGSANGATCNTVGAAPLENHSALNGAASSFGPLVLATKLCNTRAANVHNIVTSSW